MTEGTSAPLERSLCAVFFRAARICCWFAGINGMSNSFSNREPIIRFPALPPISPRPIAARRWPDVLTAMMRRRMS
jgi:hypothetical protein